MYASVAGVAFQLSDYPSDTWARLSLYAVDPHSASSDGITVAKEKDSMRDEEAGPGDGRSKRIHEIRLVVKAKPIYIYASLLEYTLL